MGDPTLGEMRDFLAQVAPDTDEFDREEAIYWFAHHWHGGQCSNLYAALCQSPYTPGMGRYGPDEDNAKELYLALEQEYDHA